MQNKKLIRFVESFVLMPIMSMGLAGGGLPNATLSLATNTVDAPQVVLSQKLNKEATDVSTSSQIVDIEATAMQAKADAIDAYFEAKHMPLKGTGMKMVEEAKKNGLDYRLLPAIAVIETTGGKNLCKRLSQDNNKNPFGWGSCHIGFKTFDDAIETVALNLGGNNGNTAQHYHGKTTLEIINKYNPPSIVPNYASRITSVMNAIGEKDLGLKLELAVNS